MLDGGAKLAYVIFHRINDKDVVTCLVELSSQVQGYREAAIREDDVQWFDRGLMFPFLTETSWGKAGHLSN